MKKLKDRKAPGEDRIPYEFFKYTYPEFQQMLAVIFTKILNAGSTDELFYKNIIFPILKKGDPNNVQNYRMNFHELCGENSNGNSEQKAFELGYR